MIVVGTALPACELVGHRCSRAKTHLAEVEATQRKLKGIGQRTQEAEINRMYQEAERLDGEEQGAILQKIGKVEETNEAIRLETIRLGNVLRQQRSNLEQEVLKTGRACIKNMAEEIKGLLHDRLALFSRYPAEAPNRIAEIYVQSEELQRAFFPEQLHPGLLELLPQEMGRVVLEKRKLVTVAA